MVAVVGLRRRQSRVDVGGGAGPRRGPLAEEVEVEVVDEEAPARVGVGLDVRQVRRLDVAVLAPLAREDEEVVAEHLRGAAPQRRGRGELAAAERGVELDRAGSVAAGGDGGIAARVEVDAAACPLRGVYSASATPILRSRHSNASELARGHGDLGDVALGLVAGQAGQVDVGDRVVDAAVTLGMVTCRRHLPTWMTSGMLVPVGTFCSVKLAR